MIRSDLMPRRQVVKGSGPGGHAFLASFAFHAVVLGGLVVATLYCGKKIERMADGSTAQPVVTSLPTLVITAPPPISPSPPTPQTPEKTVQASSPPPSPPPEKSVPVLPPQTEKLADATVTAPSPATAPVTASPSTSVAKHHPVDQPAHKKSTATAAAIPASYAPGRNDLPHPPYPPMARDLHEQGTVVMSVTFNAQGSVAGAEVAQSSGVSLLDNNTRSYIRENWHSTTYAGQTVSVPVQYNLQKL